jgi:putative PEP-CTERM system TPR-repeat lipoprotein
MRNILILSLLLLLGSCGSDEPGDQYLSQIEGYGVNTDFIRADAALHKALRLDPTSAESHFRLGRLYLKLDDNSAAEDELLQAEALGWQTEQIRPLLASALLAQGKFSDVLNLEHKDLDAEAASNLLAIKANAAFSQGRGAAAREYVVLALARNPASRSAKLAKAEMFIFRGIYGAALNVLDRLLKSAPSHIEAWRLKGQVLWRQQKLKEARTAFDQSIAHSKTVFLVDLVSRAQINLQLQDYVAAQADCEDLQRVSASHAYSHYIQGLLHFNSNRYQSAITELTRSASAAEQYPLQLFYLSVSHLIEGNQELAADYADQYVKLAPGSIPGRTLLALIRLQEKKFEEVSEILQPVLDFNPNHVGALNIIAHAFLQNDQADRGLTLFRWITFLYPQVSIDQLSPVAGLMTVGLNLGGEQVSRDLQGVLEPAPAFPREDILVILEHLQNKNFTGAVEAANSYKRREVSGTAPYNVLGNVHLVAGQDAEARDAFEQGLRHEPGNPSANLGLALIAQMAGDGITERRYYESILKYRADHLPTMLRLALLERREGNNAKMVRWLQYSMMADPGALEPRLGLARHYIDSGTPALVAPLFAGLSDLQQKSSRVLELFATAKIALKQYYSAALAVRQLIARYPRTARYHYLDWLASRGIGYRLKARQALAEALRLDPMHLPSLIARAQIAVFEGSRESFLQYLEKLVEVAPNDPSVLRLRALAARSGGDVTEALAVSERVFIQTPTTQTLLALVANQQAAGLAQLARNSMRDWIKQYPDDISVRLALTDELRLEIDQPEAEEQYLAVLVRDPVNIMALNNLAWNLRFQDPKRALIYIRRASEVVPDEPAVLDTMAMIEHINGDHTLANETIARALAGDAGNLSMRFHQAMIQAELGETAQAIESLEKLIAADSSDFPEQEEAEKLLKVLKG